MCLYFLQIQGIDMAIRVRKLPEGMESFNDIAQTELAEEESDEETSEEEEEEEEKEVDDNVGENYTAGILLMRLIH